MRGALSKDDVIGGRYIVEDWVGAGGMQNVYRARDTYFDRPVALKMPKEDTLTQRFQRSAVMSAKVNHTNIAKTLDYTVDEDRAFLVEELVLGCDLSQIIPDILPFVPPSTAARLLHQLAKGLAASHHAGVVHRDLKPSNIMVVGGYKFHEAKITDFGIAAMAEGEIRPWAEGDDKGATRSQTILGAIPYMAPESLTDFKMSGKPSDIWSIAAIVYEMMSGQKPFGRGPASIPKIMIGAAPPRPSQLSSSQFKTLGGELYQLLLLCLSVDPAARPTADDLAARCGSLCYSIDNYEFGNISLVRNAYTGFIEADEGRSLLYHIDSYYGKSSRKMEDRLWFGRHPGGGNDRAFPIVEVSVVKPPPK